MTAVDIIAKVAAAFGPGITAQKLDGGDPHFTIDPKILRDVCLFLRDQPDLKFEMLNCITGVDYLEPELTKLAKAGFQPHLEVVYHLSSVSLNHRIAFKLMLPRWDGDVPGQLPGVDSIADIWPAADWHERETFDLCGIKFFNHPDLRRILLAEDWVGYPLRKDYEYPLEYHDIRCR